MLIRSLTLAAVFSIASSPLLAADIASPLEQEVGKARPLVIFARTDADPTLVALKKELAESKQAASERALVLYTIVGLIGKKGEEQKALEQPSTMALIRGLKPGVLPEDKAKVILVGKDGEKKLEHEGPIALKEIFATIDQMPMAERETAAQAPAAEPESKPGPESKPTSEKPAKAPSGKAPKPLDD